MNLRRQIARWAEDRARDVLRGDMLARFLALPLDSQLVGLGVFAAAAGERQVRDACLDGLRRLGYAE